MSDQAKSRRKKLEYMWFDKFSYKYYMKSLQVYSGGRSVAVLVHHVLDDTEEAVFYISFL